MASFNNKFSAYSMTELNEVLEDDEKLSTMVRELDEVREAPGATDSFPRSLVFVLLSLPSTL